MSPTARSSGTSTSGNSPEEHHRVVKRRNRVPLSCLPCRIRKLKCNRGTPSCENCAKRGDSESCTYATPTRRKKNQDNAEANLTPDDMLNRIDRLENMILGLVQSGAIETSPASAATAATSNSTDPRLEKDDEASMQDEADVDSSDVDDGLATSLGVLKVDSDRGKSMYIGQEHWHTLLSDIAEVKNFYSSHKKEMEKSYQQITSSKPAQSRDSPIFLLSAPPATEAELRAGLPSRTAITTLISRYFNSLDTAVSILHDRTFYQELQAHWQDPTKSSVMWLGLVYSMLCLAMLSYHKVGDEPAVWKGRALELAAEYRLRTVQCLVVADYTKPVDYTVETMIHYLLGEWSSRWDADVGCWLITSQIVRVAFRMGYHRDAEWFPSISPFQGEMRRRAWALVRMADIMFSYQVSLPSMINDHMTDTKLPHNLFDDDFGPDSIVLPPSRPVTDATQVAYMITKTRLQFAFGNIIQAVTRVGKPPAYEEIMSHDQKLRDIHNEFPPHLKMQPESSKDTVKLIIARFNLNLLYQKIVCALHRKHSQRARQNPRYAHSRRSVMEASLDTLRNLITIRGECMPTGRLRNMQWFFQSTIKDTLLPTMLVVLDLHHDNRAVASGVRQNSQSMYFWTPDQRVEMVALLNSVKDIWKSLKGTSMEAYKASNILEIMLDKIQEPVPATGAADVANPEDFFGHFGTNDMQPEHSAAMTLGMLSTGMTPNYQSPGGTTYPPLNMVPTSGLAPDFSGDFLGGGINTLASPFSLLDNDMTLDQTFDWASFENYTQNASWGPEQTTFGLFGSSNDQQSQTGSSSTG